MQRPTSPPRARRAVTLGGGVIALLSAAGCGGGAPKPNHPPSPPTSAALPPARPEAVEEPVAPREPVATTPPEEPAPEPQLPAPSTPPPLPDGCYTDATTGSEPPTLHGIAELCVPGMVSLVSGPLVVDLQSGQSRDLPFIVTDPSKCLRVIAAGGVGVEDIGLTLVDRGGIPLAQDELHASFALVDADGPVCLESPGQYRAVLKMLRGSGKVAVQAWRAK